METQELIQIDLEKLENVFPNSDGSFQAACPMCRSEGSDKTGNHLRVYPSKAFSCAKHKGDKFHNRGILVLAGNAVLEQDISFAITQPSIETEKVYGDEFLLRLIKDYSYWNKRGINSEIMAQFEGGVASTGKMDNRYVFPMRDKNGRIHGFTGRYIKPSYHYDIVRWKHLGPKENWIFDRQNVLKYIQKEKLVILVEGIGCVLGLRRVDVKPVVPIFGVVPSSQLLSTLISLSPDRIIVSLNNEENNSKAILNGNVASRKTAEILKNFFSPEKIILRLPDQKDWLDCTVTQCENFKKELIK